MKNAIERKINKIYMEVFKKVYNETNLNKLSKNSRIEIRLAASKLQNSSKYDEFCKKFAEELTKQGLSHQKGIWRKYYNAAKSSKYITVPKTFTEFEAKISKNLIQTNFQMIKSIPNEVLKVMEHKYTSTLIEEVLKGSLSRGSFKEQLLKHGHKNAGVIARTETAKLQTGILEGRATSLGSIAYIWKSSKDKRTRLSHRLMNGVVVFWKPINGNKPLLDNMRGNAGEFPNCRCDPQPIFDESDLTQERYQVYDYRTDNIIMMKKNELLEALSKGEL